MDYSCFDCRLLYLEMLTRLERSPYVMHEITRNYHLGGVEDYYLDEVGIDHVP